MNHNETVNAILFIRPNAEFTLREDKLDWLDKKQTEPTKKEIEDGFIAYQAAQKAEIKANATAKAALLSRLGITAEEAQLLLS